MDDVDDQTVSGGPEGEGAGSHQQRHYMKQVGQMGRHVQRVVERQHQHVTCQDCDVIPHEVLLKCGCGGQAGLVNDLAHPTDDLQIKRKNGNQCNALMTKALGQLYNNLTKRLQTSDNVSVLSWEPKWNTQK